jgi:hypothetical protein
MLLFAVGFGCLLVGIYDITSNSALLCFSLSQYAPNGSVVRGPAPLPLALAHCDVADDTGKIMFSPWTEVDFRTNEKGWWN